VKHIGLTILVFFVFFNKVLGQPSYIYEGGLGGSYDIDTSIIIDKYLFQGGILSGYTSETSTITNEFLFTGGNADGYDILKSESESSFVFNGGNGDGYTRSGKSHSGATFFVGGNSDGYDQYTKCQEFIWTGTVGTGWGVAENWNYTIVPTISRPVIIPAGAPFYPNVNAGILSIGDNPNNGEFVCKSIWVQNGGELYTRINNFIENYGMIQIDGYMQVKNSAPNAFVNYGAGMILVTESGVVEIKP